MKTTNLIITLISFILIISCEETVSEASAETNQTVKPNIPESIQNTLQDGDIILRKGDGPLSFHLMRNMKEDYSHCGIIFKENDELMAIHSVGGEISKDEIDGVQTITLEKFARLTADSTLYICRPKFIDSAGYKVLERAKHYLELGVPFDHRFSLLSTDKFYCSELLYHIFKDINNDKNIFDIKKKHKSYMLMFSTFFKPENFTKVYDMREDKIN
jgi:hypothetical protein